MRSRRHGLLVAGLVALSVLSCSQADEPAAGAVASRFVTQQAESTRPPSATETPPATPTPAPPPAPPTATPVDGPARVLTSGSATGLTVALTFDAGADRGFAEQILDTLSREGVIAGFGLTGQWAEKNADLVLKIARAGHLIINHTYDHASFTGVSTTGRPLGQAERWSELDRTEQIIAGITGQSTRPFFRPPYGDYDAGVNRDVAAHGYAYNVMWSVDSRGWQGLPAIDITTRCLELARPGAIYVFHVGRQSLDGQALPEIIAGLRRMGYTFAGLTDYVH